MPAPATTGFVLLHEDIAYALGPRLVTQEGSEFAHRFSALSTSRSMGAM